MAGTLNNPMASKNQIFEARWRCAVAIAQRINELIDQGCIVLDENRRPVTRFLITESEIMDTDSIVHFDRNPEYEGGIHLAVAEYRKHFKAWVVICPKDFQPIF